MIPIYELLEGPFPYSPSHRFYLSDYLNISLLAQDLANENNQ